MELQLDGEDSVPSLAVDHTSQDNQKGSKTDNYQDNDWDCNGYSGGASRLRLSGGWAGRGWLGGLSSGWAGRG